MSDVVTKKPAGSSDGAVPEKKRGLVTGAHERSEVEIMIQRYLELAASALREKSSDRDPDRDKETA